jgi:hypothetical protein
MSEKISITVFPNGPIKVSAAKSIKFCGEQLSIEGDAFLCPATRLSQTFVEACALPHG